MSKKIQSKATKLVNLSFAALLAGTSVVSAEDVPVVNVGGTKISLYGFLQLNAIYEDGNNNGVYWTERVPSKAQDGEGRFMFNVNQTRIGFNLAGPQAENGPEVSGRFESDFANNNSRANNGVLSTAGGNFRIRQAFGQVKFKDIGLTMLFGQTSDLIAPLSAPTLSQAGLKSSGSLGTRRPMIRLTQALGLAEVAVAATDDRGGGSSNSVMPAFQGSAKLKVPAAWAGEKQNVEAILSGHYAAEEPALAGKKPEDGKPKYPSSWSGVASLAVPVIDIVGLSGEMFYGQNLKNYNDATMNISACIPGADREKGCLSMGGWGALTVKLPANLSLAGGLGLEALDEDREKKSDDNTNNPNKNMTIFGNLKYNIAQSTFIGFEYANITTDYANKANGENVPNGTINRFEIVFNYAFK